MLMRHHLGYVHGGRASLASSAIPPLLVPASPALQYRGFADHVIIADYPPIAQRSQLFKKKSLGLGAAMSPVYYPH